jgi:hypothetical protein
VLTAVVKFAVKVAFPTDQASQLPHTFTLTNDDNSYSKSLTLASDCVAGDTDGTSIVTFEDLSEGHTYTLQCNDGTSTYSLFENVPYDQLLQQQPPASTDPQDGVPPAPPSDPAPDSGPASAPASGPASSPASTPPPASSPSGSSPPPSGAASAPPGADPGDAGPIPDPAPDSSANGGVTDVDPGAGDPGSGDPPSGPASTPPAATEGTS